MLLQNCDWIVGMRGAILAQADIFRGVMPNPAWRQHAQTILDNAILLLGTFDAESFRGGEDKTRLDNVLEFLDLFNGNWGLATVQHFCWRAHGSTGEL